MRIDGPYALSIAGSDSCGGAGIQADLHTFAHFDVHGLCAITAVTAQNLRTVTRVDELPVEGIIAQLDAVAEAFPIGAVKIGMLGRAEVVDAVRRWLSVHDVGPVVLDPVMVATSGAVLLDPSAVDAMRGFCEAVDLVTPNPAEAALLAQGASNIDAWADTLTATLLKAHQMDTEHVTDVLVTGETRTTFRHEVRTGGGFHGTGCTLSSAIAAGLALGDDLETAVAKGTAHVQRLIQATPSTSTTQQLLPHGRLHA